ncbi:MAG: hypothetical protein WD800_02505 [Dehalococcoidia bacterium]
MPNTKPYEILLQRVLARPGAASRMAKHREDALAAIARYERQKAAARRNPKT